MPVNHALSRLRAYRIGKELQQAGLADKGVNLPVLYMPGILGTKLHDRKERVDIWGAPSALLARKPSYAEFALTPEEEQNPSPRVIATETLHAFPIIPGLVDTLVTAELVHVLEHALGYALERDLFFIGHDWRRDYAAIAPLLEAAVARIDSIYGPTQRFILMGQSSGNFAFSLWLASAKPELANRIARWYAFGPPWQGTFHALSMMHDGYYPGTKRFHGFTPSDIATYSSAYQLLRREAGLVDANGSRIKGFSLHDTACWREFGFGPWHASQEKRHLSDTEKEAELAPYLAMADAFSHTLATCREKTRHIPQLLFLGDANTAVRHAVLASGKTPLIKAKEIKLLAPNAVTAALAPGDDHLPLEDFAHDPVGPFVRDAKNVPYGESFMFVGKAKDHRALINYTPNLRLLAFDMAVVRKELA